MKGECLRESNFIPFLSWTSLCVIADGQTDKARYGVNERINRFYLSNWYMYILLYNLFLFNSYLLVRIFTLLLKNCPVYVFPKLLTDRHLKSQYKINYFYRVRAVNKGGEGKPSEPSNIVTCKSRLVK